MSTVVLPYLMTVEEFIERPDRTDGYTEELIDGEVIVAPCVKPQHNDIEENLRDLLQPARKRGYVLRGEVACKLTPYSLPNTDLALIKQERWNAVPRGQFFKEAPDLSIEILSPGNTGDEIRRKINAYLGHGAEQVWVVDPEKRIVGVYKPTGMTTARETDSIEFVEITIAVDAIFHGI